MKYNFSNDELFMMCAIFGADSVIGITNSFENESENNIEIRLAEISRALRNKKYIADYNDKVILDEEVLEIIRTISSPDTEYVIVGENEIKNDYIYIKEKMAVHMINDGICQIETFLEKESLNTFIRKLFDFVTVHKDSIQYMLSFSSDIIDKAIEQVKNDSMEAALITLNADSLDREEMKGMLESVVYPIYYKTVMGYKHSKEKSTEAIFKICETAKGTWIVKITTLDECKNTMIFKLTIDDISKTLYNF